MSSSGSSAPEGINATARPAVSGLRSRLGWWWQAPGGVLVLSIVVVLITTIAFGASRPNTGNPPAPGGSTSPHPSGLVAPVTSPPTPTPPPDLPELTAAISELEKKYDLTVGVAISPATYPFTARQATWLGGSLRGGEAFATIDVAMGLAVLADSRQPQDADYLFNRALADNSPAGDGALWAFLGTPEEAAEKTTQALRSFGDWRTVVPSESHVDRAAPYLQTQWALEAQSRVTGSMLCDYVEVHPVLSKLNDPADDPWGLQTLPMSYSKGAWGKTGNGDTMVRQFGLIRLRDGTQVGIAMAVSGSFDDPAVGQDAITELATSVRWLATGFDPPRC